MLALHAAFIVFVVAGGVLVLWRRAVALLHLPAVAWGAWTEFSGTVCPLTPLENSLRRSAGDMGYAGGFVEHYLIPVIYPAGLTPHLQAAFGSALLAINVALYALVWWRAAQRSKARPTV